MHVRSQRLLVDSHNHDHIPSDNCDRKRKDYYGMTTTYNHHKGPNKMQNIFHSQLVCRFCRIYKYYLFYKIIKKYFYLIFKSLTVNTKYQILCYF